MVKNSVIGLFAFVLAFGFAVLTVTTVFAATDLNFRWYGTAVVENRNSSFGTGISNGVTEYNNTDLTVTYSASSSNVIYYAANYGNVNFYGKAQPETNNNGWKLCYDWNGHWLNNCDTFWHRATHSWIYLNTYNNELASIPNLSTFVVKHELGHIFGLGHVTCSVYSIMRDSYTACPPNPTTIQSDEINWINSNY